MIDTPSAKCETKGHSGPCRPGSNNLQGWYHLEVCGKSNDDLNYCTVSYTLNEFRME
jgi:hypothetical protein